VKVGDAVVVKAGEGDFFGVFNEGDACVVTKTYYSEIVGPDKFVAVLVLRTGRLDLGPRSVERFELVEPAHDT